MKVYFIVGGIIKGMILSGHKSKLRAKRAISRGKEYKGYSGRALHVIDRNEIFKQYKNGWIRNYHEFFALTR
jgi:hypothetical protein